MLKNLKDIYESNYIIYLASYKKAIETKNAKLLLESLPKLFLCTIEMLKEYFNYMGVYPIDDIAIIRATHYNELVTDGYTFIRLYYIVKNKEIKKINDRILNMSLSVFNELKEHIQREIENYGN